MIRQVRARFTQGRLEPLEKLDLPEGEELTILIEQEKEEPSAKERFERAAGAWAGTLDFDEYLKGLYAARKMPSREINLCGICCTQDGLLNTCVTIHKLSKSSESTNQKDWPSALSA